MSAKKKEKPWVLVTGAAGILARETIRRLQPDYRVAAVDFRHEPCLGSGIVSYCVDVNKRALEDIFRENRFDAVLHLGRIESSSVSDNWNRYNANVLGTQKLFNLCLKYQVPNVTVLSSFYVYGAHPYNPAPIDESAPLKASELTLKLVDLVELDNLTNIYLWRYPEANIKLLRPCHIVGPGVKNSTGLLFSSRLAPVLMGFSPNIQLIHVTDMARALVLAVKKNHAGVYNVAPDDWVGLQEALVNAGCTRLFLPSIPPGIPHRFSQVFRLGSFPSYLVNYFKYPVIIDGAQFRDVFGFHPKVSLPEILHEYRQQKR